MILWRISNHSALDGGGGLRGSGRWHTRGHRVVYCAPNPATALLEILVHAEVDLTDLPTTFRYLEIDVPDETGSETIDTAVLGPNGLASLEGTQRAGHEWLRSGRTALLRVPSVIVPATWNALINPLHPHSAGIRVARIHRHPIDSRLSDKRRPR